MITYLIQFLLIILFALSSFAGSIINVIDKTKNNQDNQYTGLTSAMQPLSLFDDENFISSYISKKNKNRANNKNRSIVITNNVNEDDKFLSPYKIGIIPNATTYSNSYPNNFYSNNIPLNIKHSLYIDRINRVNSYEKCTNAMPKAKLQILTPPAFGTNFINK